VETDVWYYGSTRVPLSLVSACVGYPRDQIKNRLITYDEIRPGCYDRTARLEDMDTAGIEASLCFPNMFTRFCGQRFLFSSDKDLALLCVRAYNDFILDEWCAGTDRLIPSGIIPLWDPVLAASEVRRCAAKGMRAMAFSEQPALLGLPSIYTDHWDPFFAACEEYGVVLMMHVGSSSNMTRTSMDAPSAVYHTLSVVNSGKAMVDWICAALPLPYPCASPPSACAWPSARSAGCRTTCTASTASGTPAGPIRGWTD
jgi:predicted TIM-barrel fold metal-dependent hydrolase